MTGGFTSKFVINFFVPGALPLKISIDFISLNLWSLYAPGANKSKPP